MWNPARAQDIPVVSTLMARSVGRNLYGGLEVILRRDLSRWSPVGK
jgi:hypothetical protein